jgi:acetyl-CoA carboxylase biotin carboxylase subunit
MSNPNFIEGNYDTHFIENNYDLLMENSNSNESTDMVVVAAFIDYLQKISSTNESSNDFALPQSRWKKIPYINHF